MHSLRASMRPYRAVMLNSSQFREHSVADHRELVELLRAKDKDKLEQLMAHHLEEAEAGHAPGPAGARPPPRAGRIGLAWGAGFSRSEVITHQCRGVYWRSAACSPAASGSTPWKNRGSSSMSQSLVSEDAAFDARRSGSTESPPRFIRLTIAGANSFFSALKLTPMQHEIAGSILTEVRQRLHFLDAVGLDYLTLDRLASTLSGGESQRIQLATSLGSRLVGALYVLDEPSIGLHSRDTAKLIHILEELRDLGNTILVVEHDPDVIRSADYLLDLGPGAGEFGGKLLAAGTVAEVEENPDSITGRYLSGQLTIPIPTRRREAGKEKLLLRGARIHNLKGIDCEIPLGMLVCITGVSGSGKSTLVHDVLYRAVAHALGINEGGDPTGLYRELKGADRLNDIVLVDQTPIGQDAAVESGDVHQGVRSHSRAFCGAA